MENSKEKIEEAKAAALELYKNEDFVCSEAVLYTVNRILGNPMPPDIVRLASGFAGGIGRSGYTCGALIGGIMALGLAFGRTEPGGSMPKLQPAIRELIDWFEKKFSSSSCAVLTKNKRIFSRKNDICSVMTGETAARTMELIFEYEEMSSGRLLLRKIHKTLGGKF